MNNYYDYFYIFFLLNPIGLKLYFTAQLDIFSSMGYVLWQVIYDIVLLVLYSFYVIFNTLFQSFTSFKTIYIISAM